MLTYDDKPNGLAILNGQHLRKQFILVILIRSSDGNSNKKFEMNTECSTNRVT